MRVRLGCYRGGRHRGPQTQAARGQRCERQPSRRVRQAHARGRRLAWLMTCMCSCRRLGAEWNPKRKSRPDAAVRSRATACMGGRAGGRHARVAPFMACSLVQPPAQAAAGTAQQERHRTAQHSIHSMHSAPACAPLAAHPRRRDPAGPPAAPRAPPPASAAAPAERQCRSACMCVCGGGAAAGGWQAAEGASHWPTHLRELVCYPGAARIVPQARLLVAHAAGQAGMAS